MTTNNRREFLKKSSLFAGAMMVSSPWQLFSKENLIEKFNLPGQEIKILCSSDLNLSNSSVFQGMGGLQGIRGEFLKGAEGILLDAGDFLSSVKDFSAHKLFVQEMNDTGYHCCNLGHNELKFGEAYFSSLLPFINFHIVNCNYDLENPSLKEKIKAYHILHYGGKKIGITGVGPFINGIGFKDPLESVERISTFLKEEEKVDVIICLSHLDYQTSSQNFSNLDLAAQTTKVDFIAGGHFGNYLSGNLILKNAIGNDVVLCGGGNKGLLISQIEIDLTGINAYNFHKNNVIIPGLKDHKKMPGILQALNSQPV